MTKEELFSREGTYTAPDMFGPNKNTADVYSLPDTYWNYINIVPREL